MSAIWRAVSAVGAEHPRDKETDASGWTEVSDTYVVPAGAKKAIVELHYRWSSGGRIAWSDVSLAPVAYEPRIVRLATIHYRPEKGKTPAAKREQFAPLIAKAAEQKADLVVLPETLDLLPDRPLVRRLCRSRFPVPFERLFRPAREKARAVYRRWVARSAIGTWSITSPCCLAPDGSVAGKYRKVCLPRSEIEGGIQPGSEYPVFDTRFGKARHDGLLRRLSIPNGPRAIEPRSRGDRVSSLGLQSNVASPACENHVYVVSSTYSRSVDELDADRPVFGHAGERLAEAKSWAML